MVEITELTPLATDRLGAARLAVLGVNAWVVCIVVPALHVGIESTATFVVMPLPLVVLALGALAARAARPAAVWVLGAGYPTALGIVLAVSPELRRLEPWSPLGMTLAGVSLLAYLGAASLSTSRPFVTRSTSQRPLPEAVVPEIERSRLWRQRIVFALVGAGALAITSVAPWAGGSRATEAAWGDTAPEGALLTAVAMGSVACSLFALFLGPALRLTRSSPTPRQTWVRVGLLLFMVLVGATTMFLLGRIEG